MGPKVERNTVLPALGLQTRPTRRAITGVTRTRRPAALMLAVALATPALAKDFTPPDGCKTFLTVQSKGCAVSLLWRCDVAPEGEFSEASFGPDGLETLVNYDARYQWLDTIYIWDSSREELLPPATDPIDVDNMLATGIDTYEFVMRRSEPDGSYDIRVTGADQLTGQTLGVDGYTLDLVQTRLEIVNEDGVVEYRSEGTQFFSRTLGHFFLGTEDVEFEDGERARFDTTPVDIILPGEPGFGSTVPLYECIPADAAFTAPSRPAPDTCSAKETDDDAV